MDKCGHFQARTCDCVVPCDSVESETVKRLGACIKALERHEQHHNKLVDMLHTYATHALLDPACPTDPYARGVANGLLLAMSVMTENEYQKIEEPPRVTLLSRVANWWRGNHES